VGSPRSYDYHCGAAGTINITAAAISGTGSITANGAAGLGKNHGAGAGGRIAIKLTGSTASISAFEGTIAAYGNNGNANSTTYGSSAGTVYVQDGGVADGAGVITVANISGCTAEDAMTGFPSLSDDAQIDNLAKATLAVKNNSRVIAIANFKLGHASIDDGSSIDLAGKTLTVGSLKLAGVKFATGTYTAAQIAEKGYDEVLDSGSGGTIIVTGGGGSVFIIR